MGHIAAAIGVDRSWMEGALCKGQDEIPPFSWRVNRNQWVMIGGKRVKGEKFVEVALMLCDACPAQWDCARFAIKTDAQSCTWGAPLEEIRWLMTQPEPLAAIDMAEEAGVSVQVAIRTIREHVGN